MPNLLDANGVSLGAASYFGVLWLTGLLAQLAMAEVMVAPPAGGEFSLGPYVEVLEDPEGSFGIKQVATDFSDRFQPAGQENPSFGFTSSVFWLRFTIDTSRAPEKEWYLVQRHPIVDELSLFAPSAAGGFERRDMGDALPFDHRDLNLREFVWPLDSGQAAKTYYLRVAGKGALSLELKLSSSDALLERTYFEQLVFGLFFGGLLVMLIYNLVLYLSVRDQAYLYYILFLAGYLLSFVNINGLGLQYLWSDYPVLNEHYPLFAGVAMAALVQYSRLFLDTARRAPKAEQYLKRLMQVAVVMVPLVVLVPAPWKYHISTLLTLTVVISLMAIGVSVWRGGYRVARLYVLAWSVFLVGCLVFAADNLKLIPHTAFGNYAPHLGGAWVVVLLSLALGDRIKLLEHERDSMAAEARQTLERHFHEIQRLDRDKLVFLQYLSHELNTPLNWLAGARLLDAGKLPEELREAVSMVQKGQDRLQDLVTTSLRYFDLAGRTELPPVSHVAPMWLLDDLVQARKEGLSRRRLKVRNRVPADVQVRACQRELEEVLANLLDNAILFSDEGDEIQLEGEIADNSLLLRICDQGKGIEAEALEGIFEPFFMVGSGHRADGFGLSLPLARVMIEQMGGEIWAESDGPGKGACLCLRLPLVDA